VFDYQPLAVNASGDDFRLVLDTRSGYRVLSADGLQAWDITGHDFIPPVYLSDQLLEISSTDFGQIQVMLDGEAVYTYNVAEHPVESPVRSLQSDGEHWVLLVNGMLVVDGEIQNQRLDADEVFGWQMLAGQPFFFFVRAGRVGVRYGDQEQAGLYDEVIHDRCCEAAAFNPRAFADATWYYARDAGEWYLVRLATGP
jgi:hypothetical protein